MDEKRSRKRGGCMREVYTKNVNKVRERETIVKTHREKCAQVSPT